LGGRRWVRNKDKRGNTSNREGKRVEMPGGGRLRLRCESKVGGGKTEMRKSKKSINVQGYIVRGNGLVRGKTSGRRRSLITELAMAQKKGEALAGATRGEQEGGVI